MPETIILHGTGRSGTTVLNNILVNHSELAWMSNYQVYALHFPILSFFNRFVSKSVDLNSTSRNHFLIHSSNEPYAMWKKFYPNFQDDVDQPFGVPFRMEKYINKIARYSGKKKFVSKITGLSRVNFLSHAFSNYKVVWIDRDPRVVVCSMMKQKWFFKRKPEKFETMTDTQKIEFYCNYYNQVWKSKNNLPEERVLTVFYEDLVANPFRFFSELLPKLDLKMDLNFKKILDNWHISPVNSEAYRHQFEELDWALMNKKLEEPIRIFENRNIQL